MSALSALSPASRRVVSSDDASLETELLRIAPQGDYEGEISDLSEDSRREYSDSGRLAPQSAYWTSHRRLIISVCSCVALGLLFFATRFLTLSSGGGLLFPDGLELTHVPLGYDYPEVRAAWSGLQERLEQALTDYYFASDAPLVERVTESGRPGDEPAPRSDRQLRVLIVTYTADSEEAAERLRSNMDVLRGNRFNDIFHAEIFLHNGTDEHFRGSEWDARPDGIVVNKTVKKLCKAEAWYHISPGFALSYDYVWLLDDGFSLDMFSWGIYRTVLIGMDPLVSLPSMLPGAPGSAASDVLGLEMSYWWTEWLDTMIPITVDAVRSDGGCPVVSSSLWPAVYERLGISDRRSAEYVSDIWDIAAVASVWCDMPFPKILLVVASPVRRMRVTDSSQDGMCNAGCGDEMVNCQRVSSREWELIEKALNVSREFTCAEGFYGHPFDSFHKSIKGICFDDFLLRGCRSWVSTREYAKKAVLYNGQDISSEYFRCRNGWPRGMIDGTCKPLERIDFTPGWKGAR